MPVSHLTGHFRELMRLAIVGPPLSGKTTLFSTLTGLDVAAGSGAEGDMKLGVFEVPDDRLERLAMAIPHPKVSRATVEMADIPGFSEGAVGRGGRGLDEKTMGVARIADALIVVVRFFGRPSVPHPAGRIDPMADLETVWTDMIVADLQSVEKRLKRLKTLIAKAGASAAEKVEAEALDRIAAALGEGSGAGDVDLTVEEEKLLRGFGFLTAKPLVLVMNIGEEQLPAEVPVEWAGWAAMHDANIVALCADLLVELGRLPAEEAEEFAAGYGVDPGGAIEIIHSAYMALDLVTFYTATGGKELRAWALRRGRSALEAAAGIHSDMGRGFIRAEVIGVNELVEAGSWAAARKDGMVRQEGKSYPIADGDVLNIKFAV